MIPETILDNKFNCNIKDSTEFELATESTINAFTDGSKITENKTEFGYFITEPSTAASELEINSKSESLKEYINVFQAETIALINASKYLLNENTKDENIYFYTDSQVLIKALEI